MRLITVFLYCVSLLAEAITPAVIALDRFIAECFSSVVSFVYYVIRQVEVRLFVVTRRKTWNKSDLTEEQFWDTLPVELAIITRYQVKKFVNELDSFTPSELKWDSEKWELYTSTDIGDIPVIKLTWESFSVCPVTINKALGSFVIKLFA